METTISFPCLRYFNVANLQLVTLLLLSCCVLQLLCEPSEQSQLTSVNRCCGSGFRLKRGKCVQEEGTEITRDSTTNDSLALPKHIFSSSASFPSSEDENTFRFRLLQNSPSCDNGAFSLNISLSNDTEKQNASFAINGYVKYEFQYFNTDEYCILSHTEDEISLSVCKPQCDSLRPCIRKCCDMGEVWDLSDYEELGKITCQPSGDKVWSPTVYSDRYTKTVSDTPKVHIKVDHPKNWCNGSYTILSLKEFSDHRRSPFRILQNGSVIHKYRRRNWEIIPFDEICVDGIQHYPEEGKSRKELYSGDERDTLIIDCRQFDEEMLMEPLEISTSTLYSCVMIVASIFLFLTATVFIVLWKHQNIHGWAIMGHIVSLFFQYIFLISAHLLREEGLLCDITAIGSHFFFLSTFTWLTVINFDIFWTFWKMSPISGRKGELKRFFFYALFAISVPVTIVVVALSLDAKYGNDPDSEVITPEYGKSRCFLDLEYAQLPYLYGPIGFLLTANFLFFFATLFTVHKRLKLINATKFKTEKLKQKLRFFSKLFVVVGVTWVFEVISWATSKENEQIPWYWVMFDLINMLQAVAIFIIFVCNAETLYNLEQKFTCIKKIRNLMPKKEEDATTRQGRRSSLHTQASVAENGFENVELK